MNKAEIETVERLRREGKGLSAIAKETGISRSNVYGSLAGLLDKGAVYQIEGTSVKYVPVAPEQFCENTLRKLKADKEYLLQHLL